MKLSQMHFKTLREVPAEAEIPSHILLMRAGMIKKTVAGVYTYMPMGWRTIRKIENIVREEMDAKGAEEIYTQSVQPAELWKESGRWDAYGPEMWRLKDRNDREFCLGPTAEEVFTDIVKSDVTSYRQLPRMLYQISDKYRDEARPRYGMMRSRVFIMKDNYSFDKDAAGLDESYNKMYDAYNRVFTRCGLNFRPVEADTGAIGGSNSHEFTALCEYGESEIAYCDHCDLAATVEKAACVDAASQDDVEMLPLEKVYTPGTKTIDEVAEYLKLDKKQTIKALLFVTYDAEGNENGYVAAFIRGDRELNMTKLVNALNIPEYAIAFADEEKMSAATGCVGGFTGPMHLHDCRIIVDSELPGLKNLCAGACEKDHHYINMNYGRDYQGDIVADIKTLKEGDPCPICGAPVRHARGVEVGQIFKLGTKYSEPMNAVYKDENQKDQLIWMGCYGIGISRTFQAIIDMPQNHDDNGIIWPMSVAPYHVIITQVKPGDEAQDKVAERIYNELAGAGVEVLWDDRDERPGVKFKDADLIGIPVRITVGKRASEGIVEYKLRRDADRSEKTVEEAISDAVAIVNAEK
ncbi:MAG: proline--tRNA ligase [Firmicutes bacterium]|nr:proline--tRNA ligase [Bacillota bacterium]MDY5771540.1 proline--tRNA ligase [Anaerovoracaceae bacterium]